jgi:hypothetical protein
VSHIRLPLLATVAVLAALVGYLVVSIQFDDEASAGISARHPMTPPFIMFRALAPRDAHGRVTMRGLAPDAQPLVSALTCSRLHYAGGRGLCAAQEQRASDVLNVAYVFDERMTIGRRFVLSGVPTRLRVSPNGRFGAITTYGEQETSRGERLATHTGLLDLQSGQSLGDVGDFRLDNRGPAIERPFDVASVAFEADGERFFATLSTDRERYLVAGSQRERRLTVIRAGVASEALSPNGHRLVIKRLLPERGFWQLAVIDLRTWTEHDLRQGPRSVDDQVEWLDNEHVMYHDVDGESTALGMLPIDGVNGPRLLVKTAYSGVVQR